MAGNAIEDVQATPEEIAVVLSGELQKALLQLVALKIENDKLHQKLKEFTENASKHSTKF
jgi:hypothetical protein